MLYQMLVNDAKRRKNMQLFKQAVRHVFGHDLRRESRFAVFNPINDDDVVSAEDQFYFLDVVCRTDIPRALQKANIINKFRTSVSPAQPLAGVHMLGGVDDIGHDGARCRQLPGARPVKHHVADGVAANNDPIHDTFYARNQVFLADKMGRNIDRDFIGGINARGIYAAIHMYGTAEQFDSITDPARITNVVECDGLDALRLET